MYGLDEMSGPVGAEVRRAGIAVEFRGDGVNHWRQPRKVRRLGPDHDRRAVTRPLGPARDAHAYERKPLGRKVRRPPLRVAEIGVAGVDDCIAPGQMRDQRGNLVIDRRPRRNHQDHRARSHQRRRQRRQAFAGRQVGRQITGIGHEIMGPRCGPVENRNPKSMVREVQRQIGPHGSQPDHADLCHDIPSGSRRRYLTDRQAIGKGTPRFIVSAMSSGVNSRLREAGTAPPDASGS